MATRRVAAKKRSVRAETFSSREDFRRSTKKGGLSEAAGKIAFIPEEPIVVRFLDEPEDWIGYYEHYMGKNAEIRYLPCTEGDCCEEADGNPSYRYLANALIVDDRKGGEVKALKIPKGLGENLGKLAARYGTLLDRDYELSREGSGLDTKYTPIPEAPSRLNLSRYENKKHDLLDLLQQIAEGAEGEEETERPSRKSRPTKTRDDDVWDDEDDDDDDPEWSRRGEPEDEGFSPKRRATPKKTVAKKSVTRKTGTKSASTTRRIKRR